MLSATFSFVVKKKTWKINENKQSISTGMVKLVQRLPLFAMITFLLSHMMPSVVGICFEAISYHMYAAFHLHYSFQKLFN